MATVAISNPTATIAPTRTIVLRFFSAPLLLFVIPKQLFRCNQLIGLWRARRSYSSLHIWKLTRVQPKLLFLCIQYAQVQQQTQAGEMILNQRGRRGIVSLHERGLCIYHI